MEALRGALKTLPPSTNAALERLVVISFRDGTNWVSHRYDNQALPREIRTIYDVIWEYRKPPAEYDRPLLMIGSSCPTFAEPIPARVSGGSWGDDVQIALNGKTIGTFRAGGAVRYVGGWMREGTNELTMTAGNAANLTNLYMILISVRMRPFGFEGIESRALLFKQLVTGASFTNGSFSVRFAE